MPLLYGSNTKKKKETTPVLPTYAEQGKVGQAYDAVTPAEQQNALAGGASYYKATGGFLGTGGDAPLARASSSSVNRSAGLTGKTSEGATRGQAGRSTLGTSTDSTRFAGTDTQTDRSAGVVQDPLQKYLDMFSRAPDERMKVIKKDLAKDRQSQIDSIETKYNEQVRQEQASGAENLARMRSMNLRAGLGGSDFGSANKEGVRQNTRASVRGIEAERDIQINDTMNKIDELANQRFQLEQQALQQGVTGIAQIQELQQKQRTQVAEKLSTLGSAGLDVTTIKERDPQFYESIQKASGMTDIEIEAVLNNSKQASEKIDYQYKIAGNKLIAYGIDPRTGTIKTLEQEVDIPENYSITTMPDGTVLAIPDNFNGDVSTIKTVGNYAKPSTESDNGLTPYQQFTATQNLKKTTNALTSAQRELARQAGVMNATYNRLATGEAKDLNATSQAIITTFNKILDPTSVVREAEYDRTPQGQALIENISGRIASITQGGPGLTKQSLKELVDLGNVFANGATQYIAEKNNSAREEAQFWGLNPDFVAGSQAKPDARTIADQAGYDYDAMKQQGYNDQEIIDAIQ